ncbi:MAG: hypothetical protein ACI8QI_001664 [Limisphaerales bacterium]|jgi:hypothetical protein
MQYIVVLPLQKTLDIVLSVVFRSNQAKRLAKVANEGTPPSQAAGKMLF